MKLSNRILRFQDGGPIPEEGGAPMEQGPEQGGAPMGPEQGGPEQPQQGGAKEQLQQVAGQLVEMLMQQIGDPDAVAAVLQMALEMVAQAAQGGSPAPAYQRRGGRLVRIR